jgi:membrane-bound lytic murein transglycosylase B
LPAASPLPSKYAQQTIPAPYFRLYVRAASEYGLDWTKLAAVGKLESDQGQSQVRGVSAGANRYGAVGPAQFMPSTWARYGVDADNTGHINPYDPADAITAMAAYLKASGAPEHWGRALYSYNHSDSYVRAVVALSERFGGRG